MDKKFIKDTIELIEGTRIGKVLVDGVKKIVLDTMDETEKVAADLATTKLREAKEKVKQSMGENKDGENNKEKRNFDDLEF